MRTLDQRIEEKRHELNTATISQMLLDKAVLIISQQLDDLIVKKMKGGLHEKPSI